MFARQSVSMLRVSNVTRDVARASSTFGMDFKALSVSNPAKNVLQVDINRPKKLNSMNSDFWIEWEQLFEQIHDDSEIRSVVVSAAGQKMFSAGIDLAQLAGELGGIMGQDDAGRKAFALKKMILRLQRPFNLIADCPKPVIGAAFGGSIGGAIDLLSACDIRYASSDAWFTIKEVDVGLAADLGTLQRFQKIVGNDSLSRELALSARNFTAEEALNMGFISKICQDKQETVNAAVQMAEMIAQRSPVAVQGTKVVMNYARDHSVADGLNHIAEWNSAMLQSADLMQSAQAAMMKQPLKDVDFDNL